MNAAICMVRFVMETRRFPFASGPGELPPAELSAGHPGDPLGPAVSPSGDAVTPAVR